MRLEERLRDYLVPRVSDIEKGLEFVEKEYAFPGGRIDLLCRKGKLNVGVELKAKAYDTRRVCVQLQKYLNHLKPNGLVYFVAPKVRIGVHAALEQYYPKRLRYFEVSKDLSIQQVTPDDLDDSRSVEKIIVREQRNYLLEFAYRVAVRKVGSKKGWVDCALDEVGL